MSSPQHMPPLEPISQHVVPMLPGSTSELFALLKDAEYLQSIKRESTSIGNFAARLNCKVFTLDEQMQSI